jgi:hypothetical protein
MPLPSIEQTDRESALSDMTDSVRVVELAPRIPDRALPVCPRCGRPNLVYLSIAMSGEHLYGCARGCCHTFTQSSILGEAPESREDKRPREARRLRKRPVQRAPESAPLFDTGL